MSTVEVCTIKVAGPAGAGIKSSGLLLSNLLISHGFKTRDYSEYPSLVRGGHNTYQVSFAKKDIFTPHYQVNLFFSLVPGHWQLHQKEFDQTTLVFGDDAANKLPLKELTGQLGSTIYANTICLGVAAFLLRLNQKTCYHLLTKQFGSDSPNLTAFDLGYSWISNQNIKPIISAPQPITPKEKIYDGNEAYGWGFIKGGGNFYSAYPMTPASGALHFLAGKQEEYKIKVIHPEDEIAAASLIAGATFAGARSATGTSGGGFALMTETVSLCGAANLGAVFYLVSRPGPATGLPTWTSQGDLLFAINSGHGEFNKIVIAPGDQQESFDFGGESLNLAAKFNIPVIVLSDKFISESGASLSDLSVKKVKIIASTNPIPGVKNQEYLANSYEHDSAGFSTEDIDQINKNTATRQHQIKSILASVPKTVFYGTSSAKKLIISWGSTKSTILETLKYLPKDYAYLQIRTLWPIDPNIQLLIRPFKKVIVIENNSTAQLVSLLKSQFDFNPTRVILKSDGRPFFPEELVVEINK
jgi:2-oxoglutarate ferredoxin oxidoreductase subunit alpha